MVPASGEVRRETGWMLLLADAMASEIKSSMWISCMWAVGFGRLGVGVGRTHGPWSIPGGRESQSAMIHGMCFLDISVCLLDFPFTRFSDFLVGRIAQYAELAYPEENWQTVFFLSTLLSPSIAHQGESGAIRIPASISSAPFRLRRPVRRRRWGGDGGSMSGVHTFS